jgi:hypothetical protein
MSCHMTCIHIIFYSQTIVKRAVHTSFAHYFYNVIFDYRSFVYKPKLSITRITDIVFISCKHPPLNRQAAPRLLLHIDF